MRYARDDRLKRSFLYKKSEFLRFFLEMKEGSEEADRLVALIEQVFESGFEAGVESTMVYSAYIKELYSGGMDVEGAIDLTGDDWHANPFSAKQQEEAIEAWRSEKKS